MDDPLRVGNDIIPDAFRVPVYRLPDKRKAFVSLDRTM